VLLGKLQLTEGAYSDHHPSVTPPKIHGTRLLARNSSSGRARQQRPGLCYGSIGSDTGGSIRWPSAANGLNRIENRPGAASAGMAYSSCATLDQWARSPRKRGRYWRILGVIAGSDPNDPTAALDPVPDYLAVVDRAYTVCASASTRVERQRRGCDDTGRIVGSKPSLPHTRRQHRQCRISRRDTTIADGLSIAQRRSRSRTKRPIRRARTICSVLASVIEAARFVRSRLPKDPIAAARIAWPRPLPYSARSTSC